MLDLGQIRITYDRDSGYHLLVDMDDGDNKYERLEGTGDTLDEALDDLASSVEFIDGR
jgi:hypothetical protein